MEVRDPVHGFVRFAPDEVRVLDTCVMQRLRRIRQLAYANLVYPGAVHTRFDHSIGVYHIAGQLADKLIADKHERRVVRLAALIHDVGHGPFSHVSETLLERFGRNMESEPASSHQIHEEITIQLIEDGEIAETLGSTINDVLAVLKGNAGSTLLGQLISGPLDADKQDYLLRDSHYCGVAYGIYDMARLHNALERIDDSPDSYIGLASDGIDALEQFLLARYHMTRQVYRHRVRLITDSMVVRGIVLGIEDHECADLLRLYGFNSSDAYLQNYLNYDDDRLVDTCLNHAGPDCREIFERLRKRQLFKCVLHARTTDFDASARPKLLKLRDNHESQRRLEEAIAGVLECLPKYVIVHPYSLKSARETTTGNEGQIPLYPPTPGRDFERESLLFRSLDPSLNESFIDVFAPVDSPVSQQDKKKLNENQTAIQQLIESELGRETDA